MKKVIYYLSLEQAIEAYKKMPKPTYLWLGIKEKSFGLVFGISKSGKTIFCENLAIALAVGADSFLNGKLPGKPKRVLFIGLEEYWVARMERNQSQISALIPAHQTLAKKNYLIQPFDFTKYLVTGKHWKDLRKMISASKAEVVFIDSITRMNHGALEESKTAEEIMQKLREICYDLGITLICIHHTPKMIDKPLSLDKIKGSAVFGQEADFALGINRTSKGYRYNKDVFYRYAADDYDLVREFSINKNTLLDYIGDTHEMEILNRSDGRRNNENKEKIIAYFKEKACAEHKVTELIDVLQPMLSLKERQVKQLLSDLVKTTTLIKPKKGMYKYSECQQEEDIEDG